MPSTPSPVFLIHGWCGDSTVWREQMSRSTFAEDLIALDLPGHGSKATGSKPAELAIADLAAYVVRTVEERSGGPAVLVGHSMGGPVALEAAITLGESCRLLVGVDTFTDPRFYAPRPASEIAERLARFEADFERELHDMVGKIVASRIPVKLLDEIRASMMRMPGPDALATLESLLSYDIEARWPRLRSPAVAINSALLSDPAMELTLPGLAVHMMEDVGHFPMLEAPTAFNRRLASVLEAAGLDPPPSSAGPR